MSVLKNLSYKVQLIITKTRAIHICYTTDLTSESRALILLKEKDLNYKFQNPLLWRGQMRSYPSVFTSTSGGCISLSDKGMSFLVFRKVRPTISMVMVPPKSTAGIVPSNLAATPDSKSPISLDEPMNMEFTAETRPRI